MNKKLKVQGMAIISTLLTIIYHTSYADNSNSCNFYAKFIKFDNGYIVESAAKSYIDEQNVLLVELTSNDDKITLKDMRVPYKEYPKGICRSVGSNDYQALCGGYFVSTDVGRTAVEKPLVYIATLGIGAVIDAANGGIYETSVNKATVNMAKESSDILTSPYSAPFIQACSAYYDVQRKASAINEKLRQQEAANRKKQEDQAKVAYANWLASMPKYRSQLKPSNITNCGTVIEIKATMVHIQTGSDARDIWMPLTDIYSYQDNQSRFVGCHDSNRWYKRYGNWVNGDNYYQNGKQYNDEL